MIANTYLIQINEQQRLIIQYALDAYAVDIETYPNLTSRTRDLEEVKLLHDMTKDLPNQPQTVMASKPGEFHQMINGFCL